MSHRILFSFCTVMMCLFVNCVIFKPISFAEEPCQSVMGKFAESKKNKPIDAKELFTQHCQKCHGGDGKATSFRNRFEEIPDFNDSQWQSRRSDDQLLVSILEGEGAMMPAFNRKINEKEAVALVRYIRTFVPNNTKGGKESVQDFEKQFRQLQMQLQELRSQFYKIPLKH